MGNKNRGNRNAPLPTMGEDATAEIFGNGLSRAGEFHLATSGYRFSSDDNVNSMAHYLTGQFLNRYNMERSYERDTIRRMAQLSLLDNNFPSPDRQKLDEVIDEAINILVDEGILNRSGDGAYGLSINLRSVRNIPENYYRDEIIETLENLQ